MSQIPFSLFLALKYLRPKRTFLSVISVLTVLGVLLGVAVLIIVLSVMNGFDDMWRDKILSFNAHLTVTSFGGIDDVEGMIDEIEQDPSVVGAAPFIQGLVFIQHGNRVYTPMLRGVDAVQEHKVSRIPEHMIAGGFNLDEEGIVVGVDLAREMGVGVGDMLLVYSPQSFSSADTFHLPEELTVTGIFELGMWDYDMGYTLTSLETAATLYEVDHGAHAVQVMTVDPLGAETVAGRLRERLGPAYDVQTWMDQNRQLFGALQVEKNMMFILLIIISIVAGFSVCNSLIMVAIQKTRDVGLLKALGFSSAQIMRVFFWQGWLAGLAGTLLGVGSGLLFLNRRNHVLHWLAETFHLELFPKSIYHLSEIPSRTSVSDLVMVVVCVMVMCTVAAILPAYRAARLDPVRALRYE